MADIRVNGQPIAATVQVLRPTVSMVGAAATLTRAADHLNKAGVRLPNGEDAIVFARQGRGFQPTDRVTVNGAPVRIDFTANDYVAPPKHRGLVAAGGAYSGVFYTAVPAAVAGCLMRSPKVGWAVGSAILAAGAVIGGISGYNTGRHAGDPSEINRLTGRRL
jgi:hypothetical protein